MTMSCRLLRPTTTKTCMLHLFATVVAIAQLLQWGAVEGFAPIPSRSPPPSRSPIFRDDGAMMRRPRPASGLRQQADDSYYGGFDTSYIVREFSLYDQLEDIVNLASKPLPERPDGIVAVAKFTSSTSEDCRATEASYERLARDNPATVFLRCFKEAEDADSLFQRANVEVLPTFDVFYGGNRVARVAGPRYSELETIVNQYQVMNSDLDLFSESANDGGGASAQSRPQPTPWGERGSGSPDYAATPRTTAAFIPGYDFNKKGGFFDEWANEAQKNSEFDFEKSYEDDWMPKIDD